MIGPSTGPDKNGSPGCVPGRPVVTAAATSGSTLFPQGYIKKCLWKTPTPTY